MKLSVFYDHVIDAHDQTGKEILDILKIVKDQGISALELRLSHLQENPKIKEWVKEAGLLISCIYEFYEMGTCDETEKVSMHLQAAKELGSPNIMIVPGFLHGKDVDILKETMTDKDKLFSFFDSHKEVKKMADAMNSAVKMGSEMGVNVLFEDFDDFSSPMSGINGVDWFLEHVPDIGYTFDCGNFIMHDEDVLLAFSKFEKRVRHVHCKDRGEVPAVAVGDGRIPIKEIVTKLLSSGYNGYFAIEHFGAGDQIKYMERSARFLKNIEKRVGAIC